MNKKNRQRRVSRFLVLTLVIQMFTSVTFRASVFDFSYDFENGINPLHMSGSGATSNYLRIGETGNSYWRYEASGGVADNYFSLLGSKPVEAYTKTEISFDWWPERNRNGSNSFGYVSLGDSAAGTLFQLRNAGGGYAKNALSIYENLSGTVTSISNPVKDDFWGGGATLMAERWYHLDMIIDYIAHQVELTITNPEGISKVFNLEIAESVTTVDDFRVGWNRATGTAGDDMEVTSIDNIRVSYLNQDTSISELFYDFQDKVLPSLLKTGGGVSSIQSISNHYLQQKVVGDSTSSSEEKIAVASLNAPNLLSRATLEFRWWPERNQSGFSGITFMDGDRSILQFRNVGSIDEITQLQYKVGESEPIAIGSTEDFYGAGSIILVERWYTVHIEMDYDLDRMSFVITNEEGTQFTQSDLTIPAECMTMNTISLGWYGEDVPVFEAVAIDDLSAEFTLGRDVQIASISTSQSVITVYSSSTTDFISEFPSTGTIMTQGGATDSIQIGEWIPNKTFDENITATYIYTAPLVLEGTEYENPKGLRAQIKVQYVNEDSPIVYDYFNDFEANPWVGTSLGAISNNSVPIKYVHEEVGGNKYLKAVGDNGVPHSRIIGSLHQLLNTREVYENATATFDYMPINAANFLDLTLVSSDKNNPVFTLTYTDGQELKYFTDGAYSITDGFDGSINRGNGVILTKVSPGTWLSVRVDINFNTHTAGIKIYNKASGELLATAGGIPIDPDAVNINRIAVAGQINQIYEMAIDNIGISLQKYPDDVIISIESIEDVSVAKDDFDEYEQNGFPKTVSAIVAKNQSENVQLQLTDWTCTSVFDRSAFGEYLWTAQVVTEPYVNLRNINQTVTMRMMYTEKRYVVSAYPPSVVEIQPGEVFPELPTSARVLISNGEQVIMNIDATTWKEINNASFPESGERVYIYEALIAENDTCSNKDGVKVQYRVNYFETGSNYYGYERLIEYLDRGVYAVPVSTGEGILVSWRLSMSEYESDIAFHVYRNGKKINKGPIRDVTNYVDVHGKPGDLYVIQSIIGGKTERSEAFIALEDNYISIPLQIPAPMPSLNTKFNREFAAETIPVATYEPFEGGVADVDGDGEYEMIIKWMPSNSFDPGVASSTSSSSPTLYDCIKMDGTVLWRLNLGYSSASGSHWSPFMFYDLDQDGKAEFTIPTTDGTRMYRPDEKGIIDMSRSDLVTSIIGDPSMEGMDMQIEGMPKETAKLYLTTFEGLTGDVIDTIDFPVQTGSYLDWGDSSGNRANRYNVSLAYIPTDLSDTECTTTIPAVCFNRGYYEKTTMSVLTLREGKLILEWKRIFESHSNESDKGNHHNRTGDIDNDGFDEIILGSLAFDHNGDILWVKDGENGISYTSHGDANHLTSMLSGSDQLYYFQPFESKLADYNFELVNAANGGMISAYYLEPLDTGRGVAANITPNPGYEYWAQMPTTEAIGTIPAGSIFNSNGSVESETKPDGFPCGWRIYWDGDLLSELPDGKATNVVGTNNTIYKYDWTDNSMDVVDSFEGTSTSNGTGKYPIIAADLLGDWREELVARSADYSELRIYMTDIETEYKIYTLMHNPLYRTQVAAQNSGYNQAPAVGFYLGEDDWGRNRVLSFDLPTYDYGYTMTPDSKHNNYGSNNTGHNNGSDKKKKSK